MNEWFASFSRQVMALSPARRMGLLITAGGSLAFFLWLAAGAGTPSYRLLYRGLPENEVAKVVDVLQAEKISYRLDEGGTALYVPAPQLYDARIRLAGKGLPAGGGPGFELFERPAFGVTDFVHRVNYRRALQGELARSIEQLDPVERARILIATPERSPFVGRNGRSATASVVLKLHPGTELSGMQVRGIVHLVASSVESLQPEQVTVVDHRGQLLAPDGEGGVTPMAATGAHSYQGRIEQELSRRVEEMLARTVGAGRVVARVRADLDWTSVDSTEERYDPDSQIERSEQRSTETSEEGELDAGGVPGVRSNVPDAGTGGGPGKTSLASTRTTETINYEISKKVSRSVVPAGRVKRLTVAVLVDGKPGAAEGAFEAWDADSLQQFEGLAKQAVGFDEKRGDTITVSTAPFQEIEVPEEEGGLLTPEALLLIGQILRALGFVVALVLFAKLVVRPLSSGLASAPSVALPAPAGDVEMQLAGASAPGAPALPKAAPSLSEQIAHVARERSEDSMKTIRTWLRQS